MAHCYARGHAGYPIAAASSRVLQVWLAPPEPPPELPVKRPCVAPVQRPPLPAHKLPLAQPTGTARPGAKYSALGGESPPPPPRIQRPPLRGRGGSGTGGEPQWLGVDAAGRAAAPPPPPHSRSRHPRWQHGPWRQSLGPRDVFSVISRAPGCPNPHRTARERGRAGGGGLASRWGRLRPLPPHCPPHLCSHKRQRRCSRRETRARMHWRRTVQHHRRQEAVTPSRTGLTWLGCRASIYRALGEPAPGPWEGRGGRHVTRGAQSFRRAGRPGVGRGQGGRRNLSLTHNPLA